MPVREGGRFRVMRTKRGKKVRLHFAKSGEVDEATPLKTGATQSPADDNAGRKRRGLRI